jgi:hypothetical protein
MNRLLALRTTLAIAILFVLSSAALAQNSNCAYTFTWPKYAFSFCVSQYGTLGMLQAPIGVDHLDPVNPTEGYVYYFSIEGNDNFFGGCQVPSLLGQCIPHPASFSQPHGPGTLPLIADDGNAKTIITAYPSERQVIITTALDIGNQKGAHFLQLEREGVFQPGGNATFSSTGFGPYTVGSYGVSLTTRNGCFGNHPGAPVDWYPSYSADRCTTTTFTGTGTMFAVENATSPRFVTLQVQYSVF